MSSSANKIFSPSDRMLRQFSVLWIVFFGLIATLQEFHHHRHTLAVVLGVLAVTIGPLGILWPRGIKPIFIGWMVLAFPIGWTVSRVVLGTIYYGMFTPVAWLFRFKGRDELGLKRQEQKTTYWRPKPVAADKARYFRQF